ncbi:MAG: methyl-accepting chemotaxis protein, partial [Desulfatiglandales bacterium]
MGKQGIRKKFFILSALSILVVVVLAVGILLIMAMHSMDKIYKERIPRLKKMAEYYYSEKLLKLTNYASELAENKEVIHALRLKDREAMEKVFTSIYKNLRRRDQDVNSVEATDAQGVILIRGHNPGKYGDDKSKTPLFGKALQTKGKEVGVEVSTSTGLLSLDAVVPVFIDNAFFGLLKVGSYPKTQNLKELKEILDSDVAVVMENRTTPVSEEIMKKYQLETSFYPEQKLLVYGSTFDPASIAKIWGRLGEEPVSVNIMGERFLLKKFRLTIAGKEMEDFSLLLAMPERERSALMRGFISASILGGIVAVLVLLSNLYFVTRLVVRPVFRGVEVLSHSSEEIYKVANQVASMSGTLADNVSQQAASIEETSSAIEEMAAMTKQNAENSSSANVLMGQAAEAAEGAKGVMTELVESMEEISRSSEETYKIIKTIDEIAFQTNLLALNAAVEAARAGEAGAGFAVVADEVRNLAIRAAEAARATAEMIEGTVQRVKKG